MKAFLISLFVFISIASSQAQEVIPSVTVDSANKLIGQPINVKLQLSQPRGVNVDWNSIDSLENMELLGVSKVDTVPTTDLNILLRAQTITVTNYDSGNVYLRPLKFSYKLPGKDETITVQTDSILLHFSLVAVDTTKEIRDIRPIAEVPYDWTLILIISGIVIVLAVASYFIYKYYKKKNANKPIYVAPEIKLPAHIIAFEKLDQLIGEKVWQNGNIKLYHTKLTDIAREYIFNRFGVNALELTSDEILSHGFVNLFPTIIKEKLAYSLRLADMVKFAKAQPIASDHELAMTSIREFVLNTAEQAVVPNTSKSEEVKS